MRLKLPFKFCVISSLFFPRYRDLKIAQILLKVLIHAPPKIMFLGSLYT